ncbi:glycosyltransferase family 2 protein [Halarcobacter sp.]|uniref:glycosyltransferase family 2 protein n=1 Tax=Halarcobacter sp. TaxID=2321133 RepID=UPI0029F56B71|nr:glycosyltransferase family 2 protein [Halarcobacter sp.]
MINIENISLVIIAKNAELTIKNTLESLNAFDDVVLFLNDTSDKTIEIAQQFTNVNIIEGEFTGFGPTKNQAASYAKNDWVLSLDSDEVLAEDFILNLSKLSLDESCVYKILRSNYYKNREVKYCWGKDEIVRLYNRKLTSFNDNQVHEYVLEKDLTVELLSGEVKHYPYSNITDFIIKLDRYSTLFAQDKKGKKKSSPTKAFFNGGFSFFKTYFLKRGFMDGYAGLVIAFSHMATNFYKYIKLYEANKELEK